MNEKVTFTPRDLKEIKSWTLDDIGTVLLAEIDYRENKLGLYYDAYGAFIARSVYDLDIVPKAYKRFAREIKTWIELTLANHAPAKIDRATKPYLLALLRYYKRVSETAA